MRHIPLDDRIIVEPVEEGRTTRGGLVIPDVAHNQRAVQYGTVLAIGKGRINAEGVRVPLDIAPGDVVCFIRKELGLLPLLDEEGNERQVGVLRQAQVISVVEGLPVATRIVDIAGAPLSLVPQSLALPDSVDENREGLDRAKKDGWLAEDIDDHVDEPS